MNSNQYMLLFSLPWIKSPDSFKYVFVSCWVGGNIINSVKGCLWKILNYLGLLVNLKYKAWKWDDLSPFIMSIRMSPPSQTVTSHENCDLLLRNSESEVIVHLKLLIFETNHFKFWFTLTFFVLHSCLL